MKFNARKIKTALLIVSLMIVSGVFVASFQEHILKARANVSSIIIYLDHLDFGRVFPGEQLQKTFIVHYSGSGNGEYAITKKYKPRPGAVIPSGYSGTISDYCQDNLSDFVRCYKYLCPYLRVYSEEEEGDEMSFAVVGPNDLSDDWMVDLDTPAIIGHVSQDHDGGIVTENGEYGCDLSFNVEVTEPYCGDGIVNQTSEQCDDGPSGSIACTSECTLIKSSISGCKYSDINNNGVIDAGEEKMSGWEIQLIGCPYLSGGDLSFPSKDGIGGGLPGSCVVMETTTTVDGCYTFDNLNAGDYGVSEIDKDNWTQTYPAYNTFYYFPLDAQEDKVNVDFANFTEITEPYCGDGIVNQTSEQCDDGPSGSIACTSECTLIKSSISGCKYSDINNNGVIDAGEEKMSGWEIQLIGCPYLSGGDLSFPSKDGIGGGLPGSCVVMETTTTVDGCYTFDNLNAGDYGVSEIDKDNWTQTYPAYNTFYYFPLDAQEDKVNVDFANFTEITEPYCGDGNLDPGEQCDDGNNVSGDGCSSVCTTEGGGGGGGGTVLVSLQINDFEDCVVTEDGATFSWKTNKTSSSRVVCDTKPHPDWGTPPDYGYYLYTDEFNLSPRILSHEV